MVDTSKSSIEQRIERLRPWRYSHSHQGIEIRSNAPEAHAVHEGYARELLIHVLSRLLEQSNVQELRAIDLGCLEGHYSDILCETGFKEVVSIDLSEGHVERAKFLLQDFKQHPNSTVFQGNVCDENMMSSLGEFNVVMCHGLLYHLQDPLKLFEILERMVPKSGIFLLLLSTQFNVGFSTVVSSAPISLLNLKPLPRIEGDGRGGSLFSANDGSTFDRCSMRLNPAALYRVLGTYDYEGLTAYDDPGGYSHSFNLNLIATKERKPNVVENLSKELRIPKVKFYEWKGDSVNSLDFSRDIRARSARALVGASRKLVGALGRLQVGRWGG